MTHWQHVLFTLALAVILWKAQTITREHRVWVIVLIALANCLGYIEGTFVK